MRYMKWFGLAFAILLLIACFLPWVYIASRELTVTGMDTGDTKFGKPGLFHLIFTVFFLFFHLMPRVWAKRANLVVTALNLAWAVRNYFVISLCEAGDCPEKESGLFLVVITSLFMLISALFPDMQLPDDKSEKKS